MKEMNRPAKEFGLEEKQIKNRRIRCIRIGSDSISFTIFL
jgi:hypothetical protein